MTKHVASRIHFGITLLLGGAGSTFLFLSLCLSHPSSFSRPVSPILTILTGAEPNSVSSSSLPDLTRPQAATANCSSTFDQVH